MPLETATFISGLTETNPLSGDGLSQTDDHLRLIKATLKATFTNITGAMTVTQTILNALPGRVDAIEAAAASYLLADGTRPLTGAQSAGANKITNVANPTVDQDAATKVYVDNAADTAQNAAIANSSKVTLEDVRVDVVNFTVNAGVPTGGSDGDVHFQT